MPFICINNHFSRSMIPDNPIRHWHTYIQIYIHININIKKSWSLKIMSDNDISLYPCMTLSTTVPNIAKASDVSYPFTLPFLLPFSWLCCHYPFIPMDPTNPTSYHILAFNFPLLMQKTLNICHDSTPHVS